MAVSQNCFLVPAQSEFIRTILAIFSKWLLESCRDQEALPARIVQKSCACDLLTPWIRLASLRSGGEAGRIAQMAKHIPGCMDCVGGIVFDRVLWLGNFGCAESRMEVPADLAHRICDLSIFLRAGLSSRPSASSRGPARLESAAKSGDYAYKISFPSPMNEQAPP